MVELVAGDRPGSHVSQGPFHSVRVQVPGLDLGLQRPKRLAKGGPVPCRDLTLTSSEPRMPDA
jgi:hypothetical protein